MSVGVLQAGAVPPVTTGLLGLFAIVAVALVLSVTEPVSIDVTTIGVMLALIVPEPWTTIGIAVVWGVTPT